MNLKPRIKDLQRILMKNSPSILTFLGASGVFTTAILAVKATPIAQSLIGSEAYRHKCKIEELEPLDVIKAGWSAYIPAIISGGLTIGCIIGANKINMERNAALIGLYTITETALKDYQDKVIETIGEKKEGKLRDEMAQDRLDRNPVEGQIITGTGDHLIYDSLSGRYFNSDIETIRKLQNDFNAEMFHDMYKTLNEFYIDLGLEPIEMGRNMGWDIEHGMMDITFSAKISTAGIPCIVMDYSIYPRFL